MRHHDHKLKQEKFQLYRKEKNHYGDTQALDQDGQGGYEISVLGCFQDLTG